MIIVGGIAPSSSGTGRVMSYLTMEASNISSEEVRFIFAPDRGIRSLILEILTLRMHKRLVFHRFSKILKNKKVIDEKTLILVHPQTIGFERCLELIETRTEPLWLYLMDCSFFCVKSYNYIMGESQPCYKCLGGNDFSFIEKNNCIPHPVRTPKEALLFVKELKKYVKSGHVKLLAQNIEQANLARKHFGEDATIKVSGIWAEDWYSKETNIEEKKYLDTKYDVVYHGSQEPAKGAYWLISLADRCPEMKFLFPFSYNYCSKYMPELASKEKPKNIDFITMSWDTGLKEAVLDAKVVFVPSIWSAPVEGSLIKSIFYANAVAVLKNPTSFSAEIPANVVWHLSSELDEAKKELEDALMMNKESAIKLKESMRTWYNTFKNSNRLLLESLIKNVSEK